MGASVPSMIDRPSPQPHDIQRGPSFPQPPVPPPICNSISIVTIALKKHNKVSIVMISTQDPSSAQDLTIKDWAGFAVSIPIFGKITRASV